MIKEYRGQGTKKAIVMLLAIAALALVLFTLMGDDYLGRYFKNKYIDKDFEFFMYIFLLFGCLFGYMEIMFYLRTKIQIFKQGIRLVGTRGSFFVFRTDKIKAEYSEIKSVATTSWFVHINIQGNEYKVWCGSSQEAEECCETIRKLMKQARKKQ